MEEGKSHPDTHLKKSGLKKLNWTGVIIVVLALIVVVQYYQLSTKNAMMDESPSTRERPEVADGVVEIVEFFDFECPFCGRVFPTIQQIESTYGDTVKVVYKHFPLSFHPHAQKAAEASECARDQGKFKEFHDALFENQNALAIDDLKKVALGLELDTVKFNACLDSGKTALRVKADVNEGQRLGVTGTPSFFIGGEKLSGAQPFSVFQEVINRHLSHDKAAIPAPSAPAPSDKTPTVDVSVDDDPVKGDANAPVTIIEFSDFECPFCGRFYSQTLPEITEKYINTGKVKLVYRDFPLSFHPNAQKAAEASECADEQGRFWEYHDMVFNNQQALSLVALKGFAETLDLDIDAFNNCLDSGAMTAEVQNDLNDGAKYGVSGTPGFFINGIKVVGAQPFSVFEAVIEAELAK